MNRRALLLVAALLVASCGLTPDAPEPTDLRQEVWDTEVAFAKTMADRDLDAFRTFLAPDAVFMGGPSPLRGAVAVAQGWSGMFDGPTAPIAWEPDAVEVTGDLALSTGPFFDGAGNRLGRFTSIWRRGPDGWRVVFDKPDGE